VALSSYCSLLPVVEIERDMISGHDYRIQSEVAV
jgi:hypothetical protein